MTCRTLLHPVSPLGLRHGPPAGAEPTHVSPLEQILLFGDRPQGPAFIPRLPPTRPATPQTTLWRPWDRSWLRNRLFAPNIQTVARSGRRNCPAIPKSAFPHSQNPEATPGRRLYLAFCFETLVERGNSLWNMTIEGQNEKHLLRHAFAEKPGYIVESKLPVVFRMSYEAAPPGIQRFQP